MIGHISEYDFKGAFMGSETYKHNFTYEALGALFDYFTELEDCIGEQIEFDMVAICCEFSQYEDWQEFEQNYSSFIERESVKDIDELRDHTTVIALSNGGFVIQDF